MAKSAHPRRLDAAKAHTKGALFTLGVINIVNKGQAGLNSVEAAEFRYLFPQPSVPIRTTTKSRCEGR